ncbi:hypothetical protein AB1K09_09475 [Solibacillus silvestris]
MMTWSNNWISDDESIWSILMKVKVANEINNIYLKRNYVSSIKSQYLFEDLFPFNINYDVLSKQLSIDLIQYFTSQIERWGLHNLESMTFNDIIAKSLRYCTQCIQSCYHSTLHQLNIFKFCPYHRTEPLLNTCKNCKAVLSLESVFSERSFYKCVCGNYLVEDQLFYTLQKKWRETALMIFERRLFLPKQLVFYNKTISLRGKQNQFFDLLNSVATIKLNKNKVGGKTASEDLRAIYKAFLRRIRGKCKRKCLKSYYKMGRLANLCKYCKCYLKLRYQFEKINSEWDLFTTAKLKKEKQDIIYIQNHNNRITINSSIENGKYNFIGYMLFYDLNIAYYKLLNYIEYKLYDENHIVAFILTNINEDDMLLTVHY